MNDSLAHRVWECKYHVVWVPKRRRKVIFGQLRKEIGTILRRLCEYKGGVNPNTVELSISRHLLCF